MTNSDSDKMNSRIRMFKPYVSEAAIRRVVQTLRSGYIGEGPVTAQFEQAFNKTVGTQFALGTSSCTTALHLALAISGVGPGEEVITSAQTMAATSHAILAHYANPVFADVQYLTGNIDPNDIEHRITEKTRAILVVHWAGYPCDLSKIQTIADRHSLAVIEDAAHAVGAHYLDQPIGRISRFTCFSFQAIKHITTGDGGMLCCLNEDDHNQARRRRWYGIDRKNRQPSLLGEPVWDTTEIGYKYHLNDIAASLGVEHLKELNQILKRRSDIAYKYRKQLAAVPGITLFKNDTSRTSAHWLFTFHVENRLAFIRMMDEKGIDVSVVHMRIDRNTVFGPLREDLENLARFSDTHLSIPLHHLLKDEEVDRVITAIKSGW